MGPYWIFLQEHTYLAAAAIIVIGTPLAILLTKMLLPLMPSGRPKE